MATQKKATSSKQSLRLIAADDKNPKVELKPGMRLEVVSVSLLDPTLKKSRAKAARLCGGTDTCLALMEVGLPETKMR
jgi:hypothetical protein